MVGAKENVRKSFVAVELDVKTDGTIGTGERSEVFLVAPGSDRAPISLYFLRTKHHPTRLALYIIGLATGILFYHYILLPRTIDHRASDLGMMHYDSVSDKMVPIEEMKWTLHYLKNGTMQ